MFIDDAQTWTASPFATRKEYVSKRTTKKKKEHSQQVLQD